MILIAHRGNTRGPRPDVENSVPYLQAALDDGYDVEVDVWAETTTSECTGSAGATGATGATECELMLGHDRPEHSVDLAFLQHPRVWCHAKNAGALDYLLGRGCRVFFHDVDDYTLTSDGHIWAFPGKALTPRSVCVMPERHWGPDLSDLSGPVQAIRAACGGVCSDYVELIKSTLMRRRHSDEKHANSVSRGTPPDPPAFPSNGRLRTGPS